MMTNDDKKVPKSSDIFCCKNCDYITSRISQYNRHILTAKHKMMTDNDENDDKKVPKSSDKFICICGKQYKYRQGLFTHKKICKINTNGYNYNHSSETNHKNNINEESEIKILTSCILNVIQENKCLMQQNQDLTNKIVDIYKNTNNGTTINNINSNNKTFNLNVFLNEDCKDAMNIMDFVDSLKLQLCDLESVGKLGFIEGISNIIVKNLNALDIHKRPIHCSDLKRETMYVKDENKWEKENAEKNKLRKAIKYIAHKNTKLLPEFKNKYPDCIYSDSKKSDQYNALIIESMGGRGDNDLEKENKIIKIIAREVIIDK